MSKTNKERQAAYRKRQQEKELTFFQAWVPKGKLRELKTFIKKLLHY